MVRSFLRICHYDAVMFWRINRRAYIVWIIFIFLLGSLYLANAEGTNDELWLIIFGGFDPAAKKIPILWLIPQLYFLYMAGNYSSHEFSPIPLYYMVRVGKRSIWWIAKTWTVILHAMLYYVLTFSLLLGVDGFQGAESSYRICQAFGIVLTTSIVVTFIQYLLDIAAGAVIAFMASVLLYLTAIYFPEKWIVTTHANLQAYNSMIHSLSFTFSYFYNTIFAIILILAGYFMVRQKDI